MGFSSFYAMTPNRSQNRCEKQVQQSLITFDCNIFTLSVLQQLSFVFLTAKILNLFKHICVYTSPEFWNFSTIVIPNHILQNIHSPILENIYPVVNLKKMQPPLNLQFVNKN
eukprot:TRINITY_DN6768_c0_g1_i1.p6 TRINITY_DN6768_c0_g1~~TRINITY_DN6768_c0_g1_i1.p6  ORF type:complete len:112 (+),score=4.38 TRINITY_DN6768_c0_g1_i1:1330-1665(+)